MSKALFLDIDGVLNSNLENDSHQREISDYTLIDEEKFLEEKMNIVLYSDKIDDYLKHDDVIDYENETIAQLADTLFQKSANELEFIKITYEFVRDNISHSANINEDLITCTASEVLKAGHGICFAKSHLLAALLRCQSVPTGFCYQKLILDNEARPERNFGIISQLN